MQTASKISTKPVVREPSAEIEVEMEIQCFEQSGVVNNPTAEGVILNGLTVLGKTAFFCEGITSKGAGYYDHTLKGKEKDKLQRFSPSTNGTFKFVSTKRLGSPTNTKYVERDGHRDKLAVNLQGGTYWLIKTSDFVVTTSKAKTPSAETLSAWGNS